MTASTVFATSTDSVQIVIVAARVPDKPNVGTSIIENGEVTFVWNAPYNGGTSLTAFTLLIRHRDGINFSEEMAYCAGTDT